MACGGWHTLVVTSGTHMGMDLRRPFEPGLGTLVGHNASSTANNNTVGGMNKGVGHWASDLILLVSDRNRYVLWYMLVVLVVYLPVPATL